MTKHKLSYHVTKFSDSLRVMNDTNAKSLTLSAGDARNLHTDIFALLAKIAELTEAKKTDDRIIAVMDSGTF